MGVITYEITHGLPTSIPILFQSDFPANTAASATLGELFFSFELGGDAAIYYAGSSLSIDTAGPGAGQFRIDLTRAAGGPTDIGVYELSLAVDMFFKNPVGDILMHYRTYVIKLHMAGTKSSLVVSSGVAMPGTDIGLADQGEGASEPIVIEELPPEVVEEAVNPNPVTYTSVVPQDLTLTSGPADGGSGGEGGGEGGGEQGGGGGGGDPEPVAEDEDVELTVGSETETVRVWLDASAQIEVYSDAALTSLVYVWPTELVQAPEAEGDASNYLNVQLENVPVGLFSLGTIYIKFVIKLRDTAGDAVRRRSVLRSVATGYDQQHRMLEEKQEASVVRLTALVLFESGIEESSSDGTKNIHFSKTSLMAIPVTAMVGSALVGF